MTGRVDVEANPCRELAIHMKEIERIISLSDPYSSGSAPTCFANGDPPIGVEPFGIRLQTFDRQRTADGLMLLSDSCPTLIAVREQIEDRSWPKLFVFCSCGHSEFIHSDRENRACLWSECHCSGFALRAEHMVGPAA